MVTERTIINALIIGGSCLFAPYLVFSTLTGSYLPLELFVGLALLMVAFFCLQDKLCFCPFIGLSIAGTLNFLPLPLNAMHVACILLIVYYFTCYVAMRQRKIKQGKLALLVPMAILALIVLYHSRSIGVRIFGGETEGGRPAFLILLAITAYFCGINLSSPSVAFLRKVPFYCVILSAISNLPYLFTTFFPSLTPYLYYITDSVNVTAYFDTKTFSDSAGDNAIGRFGSLGQFGGTLQLFLISHYPIGTWWNPRRWWVPALSLLCLAMVLASGFRNILFGFLLLSFVGACCYSVWRALVIPAILVCIGTLLAIASMNHLLTLPLNKLPLIAQRTLSFLPGDWAPEAIESAQSSNDFRKNIQDVYINEYMMKSPWLGNGFDIDKVEYNRLTDTFHGRNNAPPDRDYNYTEAKFFITGKMFHTGWISVYDIVGAVGTAAFITLGCVETWIAGHFVFGRKANRRSPLFPLYVWILTCIVSMMIGYFTVFGDFGQTFPLLCIYALVLSQLCDIENKPYLPPLSGNLIKRIKRRAFGGSHSLHHERKSM